jgi:hypothetical protein
VGENDGEALLPKCWWKQVVEVHWWFLRRPSSKRYLAEAMLV